MWMVRMIRKKLLIGLLAGTSLSWQGTASANNCGWPQQDALETVVRVMSDDGSHASGVVVGHGTVLTAAHALDEQFQSYVLINGQRNPANLILIDRDKDLAILEVDTGTIGPIKLGHQNLDASAKVWAVGFPRAESKTTSSGSFKVRAATDGALHTTAPIDSGQSGGGLISCEEGQHVLAGMLRGFAAYVSGDSYVKIKNHSVSVASADIRSFIEVIGKQN
jgi:S1-C subfamily serine protease